MTGRIMVLQAHFHPDAVENFTTYWMGGLALGSTTTGTADRRVRLRKNRTKALNAAFLHAARKRLTPQRSNLSLLSHC